MITATTMVTIEMNNVACKLLNDGYHDEARKLLGDAINMLCLDTKGEQPISITNRIHIESLRETLRMGHQCSPRKGRNQANINGLDISFSSFEIPSHTTRIIANTERDFLASLEHLQVTVAARLVYNNALAIHLLAMADNSNKKHFSKLQQALQQYKFARQLLQKDKAGNHEVWLILLAALNNEAQIYYELCQFDKSRENLGLLVALLVRLSQQSCDLIDQSIHGLQEEDYLKILSNITCFMEAGTRSPAA